MAPPEQAVSSIEVDAATEKAWDHLAGTRDSELDSAVVAPVALDAAMARLRDAFPG